MKIYCQCGILTADIKHGSHIRKGAAMLCSDCIVRYKMAEQAKKIADNSSTVDLPDAFKTIFNMK